MPEYTYINEYEREETQKYEGTYTPEEIELNNKLLKECLKADIDYARIEELLKQGADPLGGTAICGWGLLEHVYGEIICEIHDSDFIDLPRITELFLRYGMNVEEPRVPYDGENSLHPLWSFAFIPSEDAAKSLKMLLDHGLSAGSFAEFWDHAMLDFDLIECGDPENDAFWNNVCTWTLKMLLLGASYDHVFEDDEGIGEFICCPFNTNDVHIFRNWNDFEYHYDTSHCDRYPELYGSIVHIFSKKTGDEVWTIGVGGGGRQTLKAMAKK